MNNSSESNSQANIQTNGSYLFRFIKKVFTPNTTIYPGEGRNTVLLMFALFFLLVTVYLLKPVREMLILTYGNSEIRSYSVALQVIVLLLIMPIYGALSRKYDSQKFMIYIAVFFSSNLFIFFLLGFSNNHSPVPFFIWLGAFGVLIVSQFWAFVSQVYDKESGERLFVLIALGASFGSWFGSAIARGLMNYLDAYQLVLVSIIPLLTSVFLATRIKKVNSKPINEVPEIQSEKVSLLSGFAILKKNRYLLFIALFVIALNWCSSTGEYILAVLVEKQYEQGVLLNSISESKESYIGKFYSVFYFWVNFVAVFIQFFVVSRLIKRLGFNIAFIITPTLLFMGYGLLSFIPMITLFKVFKITENGLSYSLQNTLIQILYLPTTRREKYEARAIIDTVCWKLGDLLQAASVFIGLNVLYLLPKQFLILNLSLAFAMIILAYLIGKKYHQMINRKNIT